MEKKTVLAIGPGLGQSVGTGDFVAGLLRQASIPTVIDADALNLLGARPELLEEIASLAKAGRTFVLTPHPGGTVAAGFDSHGDRCRCVESAGRAAGTAGGDCLSGEGRQDVCAHAASGRDCCGRLRFPR